MKPATKRVYKIVSALPGDGALVSYNACPDFNVVADIEERLYIVQYRRNKWTHPKVKGVPLWAFLSKADILRHERFQCDGDRSLQLWRAEATLIRPFVIEHFPMVDTGLIYDGSGRMQEIWGDWRAEESPLEVAYRGFCLCDKIRLLSRIK
jgi:hypothetical protein